MKRGPGRPRTTPIDPNWADLKAIESELFTNIPPTADLDEFESKISAVRDARGGTDQAAYARALKDLLQFHYDSLDSQQEYNPRTLDSLVKVDRYLDTRGLALVRGFFHNKNRTGSRPQTITEQRSQATSDYRSRLPRIDAILRGLGDDWDVEGAVALSDRLFDTFKKEFSAQGAHDKEAVYRASRKTIQILNERSTDPTKAYIQISSSKNNAEINLYMDGSSADGTLTPIASATDVAFIRDGISSARTYRFNKDKISVNVLSTKSNAAPKAVQNELTDTELAFTFFGGNGIYIYPEKVDKFDSVSNPDFFSTDTSDKAALYKHLIVHESGHLQMYKLWGSDNSSGRKELADDFKKFKVSQSGTSLYGDESVSESFSEQYAKYLITGNASPEFLELLSSKGLTRAQLNKKWRDNYPQYADNFFKFLDGIFADDQAPFIPEYNGPESSEYDKYKKYGAARVHKLARIFGFTDKKPTTVDSIPTDKYTVYRGVSENTTAQAWARHNEYRTADMPWFGYGIYGDGQYMSNDVRTANGYGTVAKMRAKPDAKVYVYSESYSRTDGHLYSNQNNNGINIVDFQKDLMQNILKEIVLNEIDPDLEGFEVDKEVSLLMAKMGLLNSRDHNLSILAGMLGYQGLEIVRDSSESYLVVLDRSMLDMMVPPGFEGK